MKKLLLVAAFLISTTASANVFFSYCTSFNGQANGSFSSCVNRNFSKVTREIEGAFMRSCFAFSTGSVHSFTSCVNSNFTSLLAPTTGVLYFNYCPNFSSDELSLSFTSCVNRNFTQIANYINNLDDEESAQIDDEVQ